MKINIISNIVNNGFSFFFLLKVPFSKSRYTQIICPQDCIGFYPAKTSLISNFSSLPRKSRRVYWQNPTLKRHLKKKSRILNPRTVLATLYACRRCYFSIVKIIITYYCRGLTVTSNNYVIMSSADGCRPRFNGNVYALLNKIMTNRCHRI